MQLSPSTLPLDPALTAASASAAGAGIVAPADGEATPEFSSLLSSETEAAEAESDPLTSSPFAEETANALGRDTAPPPATEQDAIAAWLAANGFPPSSSAADATELSDATTDSADALAGLDEGANSATAANQVARTLGRGSAASAAFATTDNSPFAVARAYASATSRHQSSTTSTRLAATTPMVDATENAQARQSVDAPASGDLASVPQAASTSRDVAVPHAFRANAERPAIATAVADSRAPLTRAAPLSTEPLAIDPNSPEAMAATAEPTADAETLALPVSAEFTAARDHRMFAAQVQATPATPKPAGPTSSLHVDAATEKFAVHAESFSDESPRRDGNREKHSLSPREEQVTIGSMAFGINVAKTETLMPALATPATTSPTSAGVEHLSPAPATFDSLVGQAGEEVTELAQAARRSVDSALAVAEQFASGDKRAVMLQFSVSGLDLGVRVELRGDGVHTTFRTDSPELRAALAQEWQAVTGTQPGERSSRFVDPVFTSASTGHSHSDANSADQRGSNPRHDRQLVDDLAALHVAPRGRSAEATTAPLPTAPRHTPLSTSNRLHTFA